MNLQSAPLSHLSVTLVYSTQCCLGNERKRVEAGVKGRSEELTSTLAARQGEDSPAGCEAGFHVVHPAGGQHQTKC